MRFKIITLSLFTDEGEEKNLFELKQRLHIIGEADTERVINYESESRNEAAIVNLGKACVFLAEEIDEYFLAGVEVEGRIELIDDLGNPPESAEHFLLYSRLRFIKGYEKTREKLKLDVEEKINWFDKIVFLLKSRHIKLFYEGINNEIDYEKRWKYFENKKKEISRSIERIKASGKSATDFIFKSLKEREGKEND